VDSGVGSGVGVAAGDGVETGVAAGPGVGSSDDEALYVLAGADGLKKAQALNVRQRITVIKKIRFMKPS